MAKARIDEIESGEERRRGGASGKPRPRTPPTPGRGRSIIAVVLIIFVLIASVVVWRRTYGIRLVQEIGELERQYTQLESERASIAGKIRDESSRSRLVQIVEQRGMHLPNDQQVRIISR